MKCREARTCSTIRIMASSILACTLTIQLLLIGVRGQQLLLSSNTATQQLGKECQPWAYPNDNHTACLCRPQEDSTIVKCDDKNPHTLQLAACYCLGYYPTGLNVTVYGKCMYSCSLHQYHDVTDKDGTLTCQKFNRKAELCSKCQNNTGHPLYSYKLNCVPCTGDIATLLEYVVAAYLPLTVFFVVVMVFRISANTEMLSGYILMSQIITTPSQLRYISSLHAGKSGSLAINIAFSVHAIWNLDFFRGLYRPFCYDDSTPPLLIVSLDYLIALYPMGLILLTFSIVHIHDRFTIVARIWRPAHRIFMRIRRQWNVKKSLVDAFTTFLLLSYIKILNASFDLLVPTQLHNMTGHTLPNQYYLYYDASTQGFHHGHTIYGVLAISMLLIFNIAPLLIVLLYPCRFFQELLNHLGCSARLQPLHIFMDSFLGCYRIAPRDLRHFAAFSLLVRIGNLVIFSVTLSRYYYPFGCALFIGMAALVMVAKPYKSPAQNTVNATLYLVFAFGYLGATAYALSLGGSYNNAMIAFMGTAATLSVVYLITLVLYYTALKSFLPRIRRMYLSTRDEHAHRSLDPDEELFQSFKERTESTPLLNTLGAVRQ